MVRILIGVRRGPGAASSEDVILPERSFALGQLITFEIGGRRLGIDVMAVREIRAWSPATPLPNAPAHVGGLLNLRGVILPVMDLRQQLGWGKTDPDGRHVIIVVRVGENLRGLVVDAVNDIVTIGPENIQPVPEVGEAVSARYLQGIANLGDRLIMIMDLDRLHAGGAVAREAA